MSYKKFSEAEKQKIKAMALELKAKIDKTFLEKYDEVNMAEVKALREGLEKMGFRVEVEFNMDVAKMKLNSEVTLWLDEQLN